jgi:hypothetical protein
MRTSKTSGVYKKTLEVFGGAFSGCVRMAGIYGLHIFEHSELEG